MKVVIFYKSKDEIHATTPYAIKSLTISAWEIYQTIKDLTATNKYVIIGLSELFT